MKSIQQRKEEYFRFSSQLAQMENRQLIPLFDTDTYYPGWGRHQTIEIGNAKLFVKRIPLTDLERDNFFSTQNLYDLPTYYHYGLGSAGHGVFREVVAHIKTTNWVLSGESENFPLLYHYRICPFIGERVALDAEWHQQYVKRWAGNQPIGQYLLDRANAKYEMLLFLEHIPHTLHPWLLEHLDQVEWVLDELRATTDFLRKNGMIHFDAHFYNMLTDGKRVYLTDFGLVLDQHFALGEDEAEFFNRHIDYDYAQYISNLIFPIYDLYEALPAETQQALRSQYGVPVEGNQFYRLLSMLFENIEQLQANGVIHVPEPYLAQVIKYRAILALMGDFFSTMRNPQKDTPFPQEALRQCLREVGLQ